MALPLMQSRILDVTARARSAGHLADWQREDDIVVGWIDKLKAQGRATAPGALGASLSVQWTKECKRQRAGAKQTSHHSRRDSWYQPRTTVVSSRCQRNRQLPRQHLETVSDTQHLDVVYVA
jgi:hypothetical protein